MPSLNDLRATEPRRDHYDSDAAFEQDCEEWEHIVRPVLNRITALLTQSPRPPQSDDTEEADEHRGYHLHRFGQPIALALTSALRSWEGRLRRGRGFDGAPGSPAELPDHPTPSVE
jgi:hypothetical protein